METKWYVEETAKTQGYRKSRMKQSGRPNKVQWHADRKNTELGGLVWTGKIGNKMPGKMGDCRRWKRRK